MSLRPACRSLHLHARTRPHPSPSHSSPFHPHNTSRVNFSISSRSRSSASYETLETCPGPTCACAPMPALPEGLPIDKTSRMSMPYYDRHVVIGGQSGDEKGWPSKLEADAGSLVRRVKEMLGPKGEFYRPDFSVSVTASTLPGSSQQIYLFPDFVRVSVDAESTSSLHTLAKTLNNSSLLSSTSFPSSRLETRPITHPVILICGHGARDQRCGILGPVLQAEFERHLPTKPPSSSIPSNTPALPDISYPLIGQVSHIGGHKFAGNVVIYIPPEYENQGVRNGLGGKGVWYGRVEPRHVQGIVRETLGKGRVVGELLRGVHDFGR